MKRFYTYGFLHRCQFGTIKPAMKTADIYTDVCRPRTCFYRHSAKSIYRGQNNTFQKRFRTIKKVLHSSKHDNLTASAAAAAAVGKAAQIVLKCSTSLQPTVILRPFKLMISKNSEHKYRPMLFGMNLRQSIFAKLKGAQGVLGMINGIL